MNVTVIGSGRWGSFIAWYLARTGNKVLIYGREDSVNFEEFVQNRGNDIIKYDDSVHFTTDLSFAVEYAQEIYVAISAQGFRELMHRMAACPVNGRPVILCMKGLETATGMRLSNIAKLLLGSTAPVAIWVGPGHVEDFVAGKPNCMVIDSEDGELTRRLVGLLSSDLIRFYIGDDLIGNEVGAAAKNVMGIAAGMLDGLRLDSLKGALMARGAREISRLIGAMGGNELTAYGLAHLGDYQATLFSPHSHNRMYGECLVNKQPYTKLAEGIYTCKALMVLSAQYGVEMPISCAVYEILYNGGDVKKEMDNLFARSTKAEFQHENV